MKKDFFKTVSIPALCTLVETALVTLGDVDENKVDQDEIVAFVKDNIDELTEADRAVAKLMSAMGLMD